jgi:hypothetical protein
LPEHTITSDTSSDGLKMTTTTTTRNADLEKNSSLQIDDVSSSEKDLKLDTPVDGADYTGAVGKTDPAEIALVRKLDYRIMPSLFCMYFL